MKNYDPNFKRYLISNYPEHAKRIFKSHSNAWFARIFIPMIFFLIPGSFFVVIAFFVYCIKQPNVFIFQNQDKIADLIQNIPLKSTLISISITGAIVTLVCFFIGLLIGFSRAHFLLFEAEKLELSAKKLWMTEQLRGSDNQEPVYTPPMIKTPAKRESAANRFQEPEI